MILRWFKGPWLEMLKWKWTKRQTDRISSQTQCDCLNLEYAPPFPFPPTFHHPFVIPPLWKYVFGDTFEIWNCPFKTTLKISLDIEVASEKFPFPKDYFLIQIFQILTATTPIPLPVELINIAKTVPTSHFWSLEALFYNAGGSWTSLFCCCLLG